MGMFSAGLRGHLEELFKLNIERHDPLFGALIINKEDRIPSNGFFDAAKRHGLVEKFESEEAKKSFWQEQVDRVFGDSKVKKLLAELNADEVSELRSILTAAP